MRRDEVEELHYITAIANVESILEHGILSHARCEGIEHVTVADPEVQARRADRWIPGGLRLHQYANLYFNARNAMLFKILRDYNAARRVPADELTVLRVATVVLDLTGVVVTDINAAADVEPRWRTVDAGLASLDRAELFAERWDDSRAHLQRMMAEVLVPHLVPVGLISGAYVASEQAANTLSAIAPTLDLRVSEYMFFRGSRS